VDSGQLNKFILDLLDDPSFLQASSEVPRVTKKLRIVDAPLGPLATVIRNCMVENDEKEANIEATERTSARSLPDPIRFFIFCIIDCK
jgi:hypothetical protein